MNFDASYPDNQATPGILVGNSIRVIIKAWISRFTTSSLFEAEAEVAHQALKLAQDLNFTNMIIEGDALNVINAMKGDNRSLEWRGKHAIDNYRFLLSNNYFLFVYFTHRDKNKAAHGLAKWTKSQYVFGYIEPPLLPQEFL